VLRPNRCAQRGFGRWTTNRHLAGFALREKPGQSLAQPVGPPGRRALTKINICPKLSLSAAAGSTRFPEEIRKLANPGRCRWTRISADPLLNGGPPAVLLPTVADRNRPMAKRRQLSEAACSRKQGGRHPRNAMQFRSWRSKSAEARIRSSTGRSYRPSNPYELGDRHEQPSCHLRSARAGPAVIRIEAIHSHNTAVRQPLRFRANGLRAPCRWLKPARPQHLSAEPIQFTLGNKHSMQ